MPTTQITPSFLGEFNIVITLIGFVVSGVVATLLWVQSQFNKVKRELHARISSNKDECTRNSSGIKLLEQAHSYHKDEMDNMNKTLDNIKADVGVTKDSINVLSQKQAEQYIGVMGAIQHLGDKMSYLKDSSK